MPQRRPLAEVSGNRAHNAELSSETRLLIIDRRADGWRLNKLVSRCWATGKSSPVRLR